MEVEVMLRSEIISNGRMTRVMRHKWLPEVLGVGTVHGSISKLSSHGL